MHRALGILHDTTTPAAPLAQSIGRGAVQRRRGPAQAVGLMMVLDYEEPIVGVERSPKVRWASLFIFSEGTLGDAKSGRQKDHLLGGYRSHLLNLIPFFRANPPTDLFLTGTVNLS